MGDSSEAPASYENPLIPHARLRQMYVAMLRARMLAEVLPAGRRGGVQGMEACLVAGTIDLGAGDLVSDALGGGVTNFLRGPGLGAVLRPGVKTRRKQVLAECGAAASLPSAETVEKRLWVALGAAAGLKINSPTRPDEAGMNGAPEPLGRQARVVVAYVRAGEATAAVWRGVLAFAAEQVLPIVFLVMPPGRGRKVGGASGMAMKCGVPGIAVDGDDVVAIYRVMQESVGRARAGGGAALMECMPYVVAGAKNKPEDAIAGMERYLVGRGVVAKGWMEAERRRFARALDSAS